LTRTSRPWRRAALRLGGSALVLGVLFAVLPFGELWSAIRRVPPTFWLAALAAYLCLHLLGVAKWRLLVNAAGAGLSFPQAARCYYAGLFGNTFLPSVVGGDVVRAGIALRLSRSKAGVLFGSLVDRVLDVAALASVAGLGALLVPGALDSRSRRVFWALAAGLLIAALAAAVLLAALPARRFSFGMRRRLVKLRRAVRSLSRRPHRMALALSLGVALQSSLVLLNAWLGAAVGLHASLQVWLFVWPLAKLSALVPVTQGGIGVREAALAALFAPFGVPAVLAVAAGLVFEAIIITGGLVGGLLSLKLGAPPAGAPTARTEHDSRAHPPQAEDRIALPRR
jgi:uncharacterized membrane protein YbhN (UPF0104 family)